MFRLLIATLVAAALCWGCGAASVSSTPLTTDGPAGEARLPPSLADRELAFIREDDRHRDHIYLARPDGSHLRRLDDGRGCKQRPVFSPDGKSIAYRFEPDCNYKRDQVVVINVRTGARFNLSRELSIFGTSPSWSPAGNQIAFAGIKVSGDEPVQSDQPAGLYLARTNGQAATRVTPKGLGEVQYPTWSPDGRAIAFQISHEQGFALYRVNVDGSGLERLTKGDGYTEWPMWSPDSKQIAYGVEGEESALWVMNSDGSNKHKIRSGLGVPASWAPGNWLVSNCPLEDSKIGICAVSPDGSSLVTLLGGAEAGFPAWRP